MLWFCGVGLNSVCSPTRKFWSMGPRIFFFMSVGHLSQLVIFVHPSSLGGDGETIENRVLDHRAHLLSTLSSSSLSSGHIGLLCFQHILLFSAERPLEILLVFLEIMSFLCPFPSISFFNPYACCPPSKWLSYLPTCLSQVLIHSISPFTHLLHR